MEKLQQAAIQKLRDADKSAAGNGNYVMIVDASSEPQTRVARLQGNGRHLKEFVKGILGFRV